MRFLAARGNGGDAKNDGEVNAKGDCENIVLEDSEEIAVSPDEIRTETFRSSGAGGQHVNKTDSAVRITHIPSNIVVSCQNQKSQHQNREVAMRVLQARLLEKQIAEREAEQARLRGETSAVDFGSQIRSYVLHPYRMIKDVRTGVEVGDTDAVLDGDIDAFIEAWRRIKTPTRLQHADSGFYKDPKGFL